jgi:primosomal protein N' (replication factor Y)
MLKLLEWMSGYYFSLEGTVLKDMFPREFFHEVKPRGGQSLEVKSSVSPYGLDESAHKALNELHDNIANKIYKTCLLHAPSTVYELSFLLEVVKGLKNVIILVPEHADIKHIAGAIKEAAGGRLAVYHGGLSRGRRSEALKKIISGEANVVLGSRSAVFAPLKEVSLIAVLHEESTAYKSESGTRYNARDMAVMRGFLEGATVLLSSICPSVESYHNALRGKYGLVDASGAARRPRVRILHTKETRLSVSKGLRDALRKVLGEGNKAMLYINRRGHSMLRCGDCGHMSTCPHCSIPMVFFKAEMLLRCGYCGLETRPPETCPVCTAAGMGPAGVGLERVEEELKVLSPVGVESKQKNRLAVLIDGEGRSASLTVGTKLLTRRPELSGRNSLTGVINGDAYRYLPDFRSTERAFQDLLYVADKTEPSGEIIVQTRSPQSLLFGYLRRFDFKRFYSSEFKERESLLYPPFSRIVLATIHSEEEPGAVKLKDVDVLGPVPGLTKRGKKVFKMLLKARSHQELQPAVKDLLKRLRGYKVNLDVDPIQI